MPSEENRRDVFLALCTAPVEEAEALARRLLEARLIACVNLLGPGRSLFWWQGEIDCQEEVLMVMKTTRSALTELRERLQEWHSYELPELLVFAVDSGLPAYLSWVATQVGGEE